MPRESCGAEASSPGLSMYREILVPVDNSSHSNWAVARAIESCRRSGGRITGNHVYAARLHDVRFRQLETGLPAQFQTAKEIKRQRKIHDKLIEKGLQLISDSFLDQTDRLCQEAGVPLTRQLLEESTTRRSSGKRTAAPAVCPASSASTRTSPTSTTVVSICGAM